MSQALAPSLAAAPAAPKLRNAVSVLILSVFTFGLYGLYWWYSINRDMAEIGRARRTRELGDKPWLSALAAVAGLFVLVPGAWTAVTTVRRVQRTQRLMGQQALNGWVYAALLVGTLGIGAVVYLQNALNRAVGAHLGLDAEEIKQRLRPRRDPNDRLWDQGTIGNSSFDNSPGGFSSFD